MPSSQDPSYQKQASLAFNGSSYDRILAAFYKNEQDQSVQGRNGRVHVAFKTSDSYDAALHNLASGSYTEVAGTDLSSVFMPFETHLGPNKMPGFDSNAVTNPSSSGYGPNMVNILPMEWDNTATNELIYRWSAPSGDSLPNLISGDEYYGDIDAIRSPSSMRGIGLRLPAMAVGWGYTTDGKPWPSGNWNNIDSKGFKSGNGFASKGWMVDQLDYTTAPIDLRYDRRSNTWGGPKGFWAQIVGSGSNHELILYSWKEQIVGTSGTLVDPPNGVPWARKGMGSISGYPAIEVNNREVPSGTNVWVQLSERTDSYQFEFGGSSDAKLPTGQYQHMVYQMVTQNQAGFEFVRGHGTL
jgi:hypothetical protein